ncbi:mechanosensitive ion channel family protein [Frigidibacter sp. ROC022]|uniref:mechanosensitive ion channel family protein n=1 Tax=Frigidibacter sp. ROC022 TaxID=2971796 RepID=UPI00215B2FCF|nr:mechanosensitive ion channel domain-containing protein [Frigidibacter sp. ROC022]MCR8724861.1 mechanosensitive ion channel [Frigidibacter sp. ROC022]
MDWLNDDRVTAVIAIGLNLLYAVLILLAALYLSGWVKRRVQGIATRYPKVDVTLFSFLGSLAQYAVLAFAGVFILGRFGIQTTSLVALIGAAGLAIGLALQGTLSNLAAGVMLVIFRPFRVGDYIEGAGTAGTVKTINLFFTELATPANVQIIVPNGDIWASAITNYSVNETRRIDLTVGVGYGADLKQVDRVLAAIVAEEPRALADPAPFIKVANLGDSSVDFAVRVWVRRADWWDTKCDLTRAIKDRFDAEGIDIPFPTRTLVWPDRPEPPEARVMPAE